MSYSYSVGIGDGVTKAFPFSFAGQDNGYLSVSNIKVYVAGNLVPFNVISSDPNKVYLVNPPPLGAEVLIRRVMPKNVPYTDFSRGNPFSQDALNNTNLQQLYIVQEIFDGYLPDGFFFRTDIDMRGHKFLNLGKGVNDGDSVNYAQLKSEAEKNVQQDGRLTVLEDALKTTTFVNFVSQLFVSTVGGETKINTTGGFPAAAVYINGILQYKLTGAYSQDAGVITLAEPLIKGQKVYLILGGDLPDEALYPSIQDFVALQNLVSQINTALTTLKSRVDDIDIKYAKRGDNSDITKLSGLTSAITVAQGGTGATTADVARNNLGLGSSAVRNVGETNSTVLSGDAAGRMIKVTTFTSDGTFTPDPRSQTFEVDVVGGGGAGGGSTVTTASQASVGCGGNSGSWFSGIIAKLDMGSSQAVKVGAGGISATGAAGGSGGQSSIGTLVTCPGGTGGGTSGSVTPVSGATFVQPPARQSPTAAVITPLGWKQTGQPDAAVITTTTIKGSDGGDSQLGSGGIGSQNGAGSNSTNGYGAGGGGSASPASTAAARAGGNGKAGIVIIREYT